MRAARLIKMVLLLQSRPSMTAAELARELEVSERTITRDAQALSEAGVPVYADRGRTGGYRLVGGYRTRLTGLARSEAEALFLSGVPGALREMGLEDASSAALLKVSAALLPSLKDASRTAAQRFHLDAPAWFAEPKTPELLPAIAEAVWDDRRITARYRREDTDIERELEPYGLVLKAGVWYVCARVAGGPEHAPEHVPEQKPGPFRVYRIERFTSAEPAGDRFERDGTFDLPGFWADHAERFARSLLRATVVVRLTEAGARRLRHTVDPLSAQEALDAAGPPDGEGRVTLTLPVESYDVAYTQFLSLGPEAEVLEPTELRKRFSDAAARIAAYYGDPGRENDG
ncbi:transcriptional regulator [Streptomyces dioscori]|uniref:Transcriptional regulator n=1 Tax=Streptomyces dioscori TaxID=2109333 RepID=A0A2P8Q4R6_9ACTN|nr:WYL domain-containing protein [Streptomyces dioscori]PSM41236.1 transcriptional regulator [Streptomyces dioscori]